MVITNGRGFLARPPNPAIRYVPSGHRTPVDSCRSSWAALGSKMSMVHDLLCSMLTVQASGTPAADEQPDVVLESVQIGARSVQFYVDFGSDSAVLGFSVENDSGQKRYFPMYGSTYRGLPSVTLDVFVSDSQEEMWVHSSWQGYEILAYHRVGTDLCTTRYGEITSFDRPTPESLGGVAGPFPEMDFERVSRVATLAYDPGRA